MHQCRASCLDMSDQNMQHLAPAGADMVHCMQVLLFYPDGKRSSSTEGGMGVGMGVLPAPPGGGAGANGFDGKPHFSHAPVTCGMNSVAWLE